MGSEDSTEIYKERGQRLRDLREALGLSRAKLEEKYDLSQHTLRAWEEGKNAGLTPQGARTIVAILNKEGILCSIGWLLAGEGSAPKIDSLIQRKVDYLSQKTSTSNRYETSNAENIYHEIDSFLSYFPHATYLTVDDDSAEPVYTKGDIIGGNLRYGENFQCLIGKLCIIETQMGEKYCRILQRGTKPNHYHLIALNPLPTHVKPIINDAEVASAAFIIRIWKNEMSYSLGGHS